MRVILTGSTGFIGEGVLLECLESPHVEHILSISRKPSGYQHEKLEEYLVPDLMTLTDNDPKLQGYDTVLFCAGKSSNGMTEEEYTVITITIPKHFADILPNKSNTVFIYLSGGGSDPTGKTRMMFGRVKGRAENVLEQIPYKAVYFFRPSFIKARPGQIHQSPYGSFVYHLMIPMFYMIPSQTNSTTEIGRAMIAAAKNGFDKHVVTPKDITALAKSIS